MAVSITFANPNLPSFVEDSVLVYRSLTPMDPGALPTPLATIATGSLSYTDATAVDGTSYYYRVAFVKGASVYVSEEVLILAPTGGGIAAWPEIVFDTYVLQFAVVNQNRRTVAGKAASYLNADWWSVGTLALALVVMKYKADVLTTETVTVIPADVAGFSGGFYLGLAGGDVVTWRQLLDLMLVPAGFEQSYIIERVLGGELLAAYRRGSNAREAIAAEMQDQAVLANCNRYLFSSGAELVTGETTVTRMLIAPDDVCRLLMRVGQNPTLVSIMQQKSVTITVAGTNPRTLPTYNNTDRNVRNIDFGDVVQAGRPPRYILGKTGDRTAGFDQHQAFLFEAPNGQTAAGCIYNTGRNFERQVRVNQAMMIGESVAPSLRSPETAADPHAANVVLRIKGNSIVDASPSPKTLVNNGVALVSSPYMYSTAMEFALGDYIEVVEPMDFGSGDFTIELFMRGLASLPYDIACVVFGQWRVDGQQSFRLSLENSSTRFWWSTNGSDFPFIDFQLGVQASLDTRAPHHICVQRSGTAIRIFVNGVAGAAGAISGAIHLPTIAKTLVGLQLDSGGSPLRRFGGIIDEICVTKGVALYPMTGFNPIYRENRWG